MSRPTTLMIAMSRTRIGGLTKVTFLENETSRRCERLSIPSTVYRVLSCSSVGFRSCSQYLAAGRSLCSDRPAGYTSDNSAWCPIPADPNRTTRLKELASQILAYDDRALAQAVAFGTLIEVICHEKN